MLLKEASGYALAARDAELGDIVVVGPLSTEELLAFPADVELVLNVEEAEETGEDEVVEATVSFPGVDLTDELEVESTVFGVVSDTEAMGSVIIAVVVVACSKVVAFVLILVVFSSTLNVVLLLS